MSVVPYEVTINEIEGTVIHLTVRLSHIGFSTLPISKTFAFELLGQPLFFAFDECVPGMPLSQALGPEDVVDKTYILKYAGGFIDSVNLTATQNYPTTEKDLLEALESGDPSRQVIGSYQITVTHPAWTLHLTPGMAFESTAFDLGDEDIWVGLPRVPGDITWRKAVDQAEGFKPYLPDDVWLRAMNDAQGYDPRVMHEVWLQTEQYVVPARGAFYYEAEPVWIGDEITPEILHSLLHQPVVLGLKDNFFGIAAGLLIGVEETHLKLGLSRQRKSWLPILDLTYIGVARYRIPLIHGRAL